MFGREMAFEGKARQRMSLRCPKCGRAFLRADGQCPKCGEIFKWAKKPEEKAGEADKPAATPRFCAECGNKLETGQKFCPECGRPVVTRGGKEKSPLLRAAGYYGPEARTHGEAAGGRADARKYDEAVGMSQKIEGQAVGWANCSGCLIDPVFGGWPLLIACHFWPEIWIFLAITLGFGVAAMCFRMAVRKRLVEHDTAGAQKALGPAKTCFGIALGSLAVGFLDVLLRLMALASK